MSIFNNSTLYIGDDAYFNGTLNIILSEEKNFFVGNGCLFSFGIWVRTADPHLIYDAETKVRINPSKSILIGDHVWIGQSAMLLKGCHIASGCILGAASIMSKATGNNQVWAGNPAKKVKKNIFWSSESVHNFTYESAQKYNVMNKNDFIFTKDDKMVLFKHLDAMPAKLIDDKLSFIINFKQKSGF